MRTLGSSVRSTPQQAAEFTRRPWFRALARIGIGARGVIYVVLAYLALDVALHGSSPSQTNAQGAVQEVGRQSGGAVLLVLLAIGLAAYAGWRLVQALTGQPGGGQSHGGVKRVGWLAIAVVYAGLCVRAVELLSGSSSGSSSASSNPRPWAARVLKWPAGTEVLVAGGAVLIVVGAGLAIWGLAHDLDKDLRLERLTARWRAVVRTLSALGNLARGFLVALVGWYLVHAGTAAKASRAKTVDAALKALAHQTYGAALIGLVAVGLLCFGLYSFFEARLRRL